MIRGMKISALLACQDGDIEGRIFAPFWGSDANKAALSANIKHRTNK